MKLTRRKSFLINLALMASSLVCCLGGLEAAAWLWERNQAQGPYAWELVASRRIQLDRYETAGGGYTLMRPGGQYEWQGIPVQINSQGLRGPEVDLEKPPGTYRVLNLGDSVVFGWGVRYEDAYGHRLQERLNQQNDNPQVRYEVISAGAPGWNMDNALAYLETQGLACQPDLVLLTVTLVNDVYGGSALDEPAPSILDWLRDNTYLWPFLSVQRHLLLVRMGRQEAVPVLNPPREAAAYFPLSESDPQWDRLWEPISAMAALADQHDSEFLLILLPTAFQVEDTAYSDLPQRVIGQRASEEGIGVLDLLPVFREACREAPDGESCGPEGRYLWADMWMHPSPLGHQLMAESILDILEEAGRH